MRDATPEEMAKVTADLQDMFQKIDAARFLGRIEGYPAELNGGTVTIVSYNRGSGEHVPICIVYNEALHEAVDVFHIEGSKK